ncbi:hypothetical protein BV25DRAFT_1830482 [Artomyces pyxidatus]|uniref:Uncharacterized protein n=1 Tax=Artomyces pyxidatus TaxID=48021 RepID=A0ACB8SQK9_9AGAM|nr:hypothetical protein BV25DRAFT_1830482 [Artomyces pyxidatus]
MMVADAVDTVSFGIPISYVTHSVPSGGYHSQPIYPVYLPPQEQLSLPAPSPLPLPPPSAVIYQPNPQPLHRTIKWADPPTLEREPSPPPSPVKKRRVYKPIQPIACFFCRTRKIACGPPPGGGEDKTCAQCLRRGYTCEYPTESHRGCRRLTTAQAA